MHHAVPRWWLTGLPLHLHLPLPLPLPGSQGGGPDGPMVQNISSDGSQIALVLDLGAHHLDLMFSDERSPPCFFEARKIEKRMIRQWCQEAYDKHACT